MIKSDQNLEEITIFERTIQLRNEIRNVDELTLDPTNPRISHEYPREEATPSQKQLIEYIWKTDASKKLYRSILRSKGIQNPIYIKNDGLVVEGNRRIVVCKIMKQNLASSKINDQEKEVIRKIIQSIPVKVLPDDISQVEIDILLAREHISGKNPWRALNQAEHIWRMNNYGGFTVLSIAETIERSRPWVDQKLKAFEWTRAYLKRNGKAEVSDFSYFEEMVKKSTALKKAGLDVDLDENRKYVENLIKGKKLTHAIQIRKLPNILKDDESKKALEDEGYEKAFAVVMLKDPSMGSRTFKKLNDALDALNTMPRNEYFGIVKNPAQIELVLKLAKELSNLTKELDISS